jgi:2-polyprenyl-6-methoxyphenol hydroxylase-like FAD-dependent oxidoreductase
VLVGDAAHATHPAGATGMSLAISGAARLAELLSPALLNGRGDAEVDAALETYNAERRPAAITAITSNHAQALRLWQSELFRDPDGYARAIDPSGAWGAGGAGWGQDPAALSTAADPLSSRISL